MNFIGKRDHKGFTLAETLITLVIIGVIAALTVLNLIIAHKKSTLEANLKEAYSILNQALKLSEVDNGARATWNFTVSASSKAQHEAFFKQYIVPHVKTTQYCPRLGLYSICEYKPDSPLGYAAVILSNGMVMYYGADNAFNFFTFDLNGKKPPNKGGKDIFYFLMLQSDTQRKFYYLKLASNQTLRCGNLYGFDCANIIINNSWQIPDDYPIKL